SVPAAPPVPDRGELRRLAREDGDKLADALTFRLVIETGAAEALAQVMARSSARSSRVGRRLPPGTPLPGSISPARARSPARAPSPARARSPARAPRSEQHTSALQSLPQIVCRLLLDEKHSVVTATSRSPDA